MAYVRPKNTSSTSTTWTESVDKLRGTPAGRATAPKAASRWFGLKRRLPTDPLNVRIRYRGGAEAWWLVEARGRTGAFPGHMCIHDVMREINRDWTPDE